MGDHQATWTHTGWHGSLDMRQRACGGLSAAVTDTAVHEGEDERI
jgi:hypothetical protein